MSLTFPDGLGPPLRDSYRVTLGDGRRFGDRDAGPQHVALGTSTMPDLVEMTIDVDNDGAARFWEFWRETKGGVLAFAMPDWLTDGWPLLDFDGEPLLDGDDVPLLLDATFLCTFAAGAPAARPVGVRQQITMQILVWP